MKRGTPRHPKVRDLCDQLGCNLALAVGYLELLWHFTAEFAPQGDIGRYSDKRIEGALDWHRSTGGLVRALVTSGWVDPHPDLRLTIHDWHEHCDDSVRKRLLRANLSFLTDRGKVTGHFPTMSGTLPDNGSLPILSSSSAYPSPVDSNGHAAANGDPTTDRWTEEETAVATWLKEFPGSGKLPGEPDREIIQKCLQLGTADKIKWAMRELGIARKAPSRSWAWFPVAIGSQLGIRRKA